MDNNKLIALYTSADVYAAACDAVSAGPTSANVADWLAAKAAYTGAHKAAMEPTK